MAMPRTTHAVGHHPHSLRRGAALLVTAVSLVLSMLVGCRPPEDRSAADGTRLVDGVSVSLRPVGPTTLSGFPIEVLVTRDGAPVGDADVVIVGEMTHAGMPRLLLGAVEVEPGRYLVERFEPSMPGDWIISAEASLPGAYKVTAELFLTFSD